MHKKNTLAASSSSSTAKTGRKYEELDVNPDNIVSGKRHRVDIDYIALNEEVSFAMLNDNLWYMGVHNLTTLHTQILCAS